MEVAESGHVQVRAAAELGRICAVAVEGQRDLQSCVEAYPDLFPPRPFDPTLMGTVCQANAFSAPWLEAHKLRVANRASLWGFGVDWHIDYLATSHTEVQALVRRCLAVAAGAAPADGDQLTQFLASIRDDLGATAAFGELRPLWCDELRRMLAGMAQEWRWRAEAKAGSALPTFDEYIANSDNLGSSFVDISHWIFTMESAGTDASSALEQVTRATRAQQKVLRLLNDLASYGRDVAWGDLNAMMLGVSRADVARQVAELVDVCVRHTTALRARQPELATFLERQVGFCMAFYQRTDYWGADHRLADTRGADYWGAEGGTP